MAQPMAKLEGHDRQQANLRGRQIKGPEPIHHRGATFADPIAAKIGEPFRPKVMHPLTQDQAIRPTPIMMTDILKGPIPETVVQPGPMRE